MINSSKPKKCIEEEEELVVGFLRYYIILNSTQLMSNSGNLILIFLYCVI